VLLAGALAGQVAPSISVALCGAAGAACAVFLARARSSSSAVHPADTAANEVG